MNPPMKKDLIKVVREGEESGQHEDAVTATWTGYLNGHWTQTKPKRPGCYQVADELGKIAGYIVIHRDPRSGALKSKPWKRWWWSFPLPPTPVSPPEIWEEEAPALRLVKNE